MAKQQMAPDAPKTVSIKNCLATINNFFSPRTVALVNETAIRITKVKGEFIWHFHEKEDELFLVLEGKLLMKLRTGDVWVNEGEFIVIPKGIEHCPIAPEEVHLMLVEPQSTTQTGNIAEVPISSQNR